jgi:hydroxylamine reductase
MPGFAETLPEKRILTGFGHDAVLGVADKVLEAVQNGSLERICLIGGCDGSEGERSAYTDLAMALPDTALILTLGCAKFRLLGKKDYGTLPGTEIPRLLDMGQCNDSYSAVVVASKLAEVLKTDINSLPLSITLSWLEQKAVAVLLSLLHLNVKGIRIGPNAPAFVTPNILKILQDNYNLQLVDPKSTDRNVAAAMGRA